MHDSITALAKEVSNDVIEFNGAKALVKWAEDHVFIRIILARFNDARQEDTHHSKRTSTVYSLLPRLDCDLAMLSIIHYQCLSTGKNRQAGLLVKPHVSGKRDDGTFQCLSIYMNELYGG